MCEMLATYEDVVWAPIPNRVTMVHSNEAPPASLSTAVEGIVTDQRGYVLLVETRARGWDLPGGHVEADERLEDALRRELREESGCEISAPEPVGYYEIELSNGTAQPRGYPTPISYIVVMRATLTRRSELLPNREIAQSAFVPQATIETLCADHVWRSLVLKVLTP